MHFWTQKKLKNEKFSVQTGIQLIFSFGDLKKNKKKNLKKKIFFKKTKKKKFFSKKNFSFKKTKSVQKEFHKKIYQKLSKNQ